MVNGTVKSFKDSDGYGYLSVDGKPDVFVHYSDIEADPQTLKPDQQVTLHIEQGMRGPRAKKVKPL
ncbi:MAG: cold shock domain-containing protein [Planctomycetota bacterium]|nr:cold shock domain-containing protein [Planctomycetota bacterium]